MGEFYDGGTKFALYQIDETYSMGAPDDQTADGIKLVVTERDFSMKFYVKVQPAESTSRCIANILAKHSNAVCIGTTKKIPEDAVTFSDVMSEDYLSFRVKEKMEYERKKRKEANERRVAKLKEKQDVVVD